MMDEDVIAALNVDDEALLEVLLTDDSDELGMPSAPPAPEPEGELEPTTSALDGISLFSTTVDEESMPRDVTNHNGDHTGSTKLPAECEESTDAKDLKKQRRLIRNRMSAQLHRERKKAYIDKLEAEVKDRDSIIFLLRQENEKLRRLLTSHGIVVVSEGGGACAASDSGCTTNDDSADSDGSETPLPRKRPLVHSASLNVPKRPASGTFLGALACLLLFQAPPLSLKGVLPWLRSPTISVPEMTTRSPNIAIEEAPLNIRAGGRVLMDIPEGEDTPDGDDYRYEGASTSDEALSSSLTLVPTQSKGRLRYSIPDAPDVISKDRHLLNDTNYFVCPSMVHTSEEPVWHHALNQSEEASLLQGSQTRGQARRRLRHRRESNENDAVVHQVTSSSMSRSQKVSISKLILAGPHHVSGSESSRGGPRIEDDVPSGSLVLRDRLHHLDGYAADHSYGSDPKDHDEMDDEAGLPNLMLVVPSSSLEGFAPITPPTSWVEIGCRIHSARFVDFSTTSVAS